MVAALIGGVPGGGTRYTAYVMDACGIPTGHEKMFRENPNVIRPTYKQIEVSWLCVPWFSTFKGSNILVARAPYNVIRSQYAFGFLLQNPKPSFMDDIAYWPIMSESGLNRLASFYYRWMSWGLAHCDQVISVHEFDRDTMKSFTGLRFPNVDAVKTVKRDTGSRYKAWSKLDIDWSELSQHYRRKLTKIADDLGVPTWSE